ncbi:MAG: hypothetical protein ACLQBQ_10690, partial [Smithella sp.]
AASGVNAANLSESAIALLIILPSATGLAISLFHSPFPLYRVSFTILPASKKLLKINQFSLNYEQGLLLGEAVRRYGELLRPLPFLF